MNTRRSLSKGCLTLGLLILVVDFDTSEHDRLVSGFPRGVVAPKGRNGER